MKKALSLALAVLMVLGMTSVAFAAHRDLVGATVTTTDKVGMVAYGPTDDTYYPDDTVRFYLVDSLTASTYEHLDKASVTKLKLTAQVKVAGSNSYIKDTAPTIKYESKATTYGGDAIPAGAAYFEVTFIDPFVSTSSKDFELTAYLRENKSQSGIELLINGTFKNYPQDVTSDDDYVYGVDYRVITADGNVKKIEVELDYGLTITTRMTDGKKYYGHVSMDPTSGDEAIMDQYPNIVEVYNLKTINLNPAGDVVRFADDAMFAYTLDADGNLVFLGKTNKAVPYFTKYFLSTTELDLPVAEVEEPVEDVVPDVVPDVVVDNANDNPGTGC
jgi:hypothetical protein